MKTKKLELILANYNKKLTDDVRVLLKEHVGENQIVCEEENELSISARREKMDRLEAETKVNELFSEIESDLCKEICNKRIKKIVKKFSKKNTCKIKKFDEKYQREYKLLQKRVEELETMVTFLCCNAEIAEPGEAMKEIYKRYEKSLQKSKQKNMQALFNMQYGKRK